MTHPTSAGIGFAGDANASSAFCRITAELAAHFGDLPEVPRADQFRARSAQWLPRFEAARLVHPARVAIAERAAAQFIDAIRMNGGPVREACALSAEALAWECQQGTSSAEPTLQPLVERSAERAASMWQRGQCSRGVVDAFDWLCDHAQKLDLSGERFVLLGAGAELAPTALLLRAGANVLWLDRRPPALPTSSHRGSLYFAGSGVDLLSEPAKVRATVEAFAQRATHARVHLGLFAYAPGRLREWGLCATMNALVEACKQHLASVTLLLSPASPNQVAPMQRQPPTWPQRLLPKAGGGQVGGVSRTVVPVQGISYQAAQYLGKRLTSEAWAHDSELQARISCNVAPVSRTRSLEHPMFAAAFAGAHHLGVRIFDAEDTAQISGLLMLRDLLGPNTEPARAYEQQVHGGAFGLTVPLQHAITVAAALGLGGNPGLLGGLLWRPRG